MLVDSFHSIGTAAQRLLKNWRAMIVLAVLYAALLGSLYLFVTIREATVNQVVLTLLLAVAAPLLFFLIQTAGLCQIRKSGFFAMLRETLGSFWKVLVVSLPLLAFTVLVLYLLTRLQRYVGAPRDFSDLVTQYQIGVENGAARKMPWGTTLLTSVRYLLIGVVLPIVAIHFWIAAANEGLLSVIRTLKRILFQAFAPNSVLIYVTGFLVFGLFPYLVLFKAIPVNRPWLEMVLFVIRLMTVFALTLFGWVATVAALAESAQRRETTSEVL